MQTTTKTAKATKKTKTARIRYTTRGSVRGTCGHEHVTLRAAARCADRDQSDCASLPGGHSYSDRQVERTDGAPLSPDERELLREMEEVAW